MKASLFLRIASVLTWIHCVLHTVGGVFGSPKHGAEEIGVIETMKSHQFNLFGSTRSYWDLFFGYGLFVTLALLVAAILLWQLAVMVRSNRACVRWIVSLLFFNYFGMAIVSWKYFFLPPAVTEVLIAGCLAVAFLTIGRH